jgi:hypothetical protein
MPHTIYALTNDRAELLTHRASCDDITLIGAIVTPWLARGFIVRVCNGETDALISEFRP